MVSTSVRNAGGPWFDSRSRHDRFLFANSVYIYIYIYIYIYSAKSYLCLSALSPFGFFRGVLNIT